MDLHSEIKAWKKKGKPFKEGILLLEAFNKNRFYIGILKRKGDNERNIGTIEYELTKLDKRNVAGVKPLSSKQANKNIPVQVQGKKEISPTISTKNIKTVPVRSLPEVSHPVALKLRDEFPFLSRTDCPDEFKILVNDMLTAWEVYRQAHKDLFDCKNEDYFTVAERLVTNYLNNRLIWKELRNYKDTGKILGEHTIFEEKRIFAKYDKMNANQLNDLYIKKLPRRMWQNKSKIEQEPDSPLNENRLKRAEQYKREFDYVEKLLKKFDKKNG